MLLARSKRPKRPKRRDLSKRIAQAVAVTRVAVQPGRATDFFERYGTGGLHPAKPPSLDALLRGPNHPPLDLTKFDGLSGQALRDGLRDAEGPGRVIAYRAMRALAFAGGLAGPGGFIREVYAGLRLKPGPIANERVYNWEHLVPQSWRREGMLRALRDTIFRWHLFNGMISDSFANSKRGHRPFGEVVPGTEQWSKDGAKLGLDALGREVFEPPTEMRGEIAVRVLWVYTEAPELFPEEYEHSIPTLVRWALEDPLDEAEELEPVLRAEKIEGESLYYAHADRAFILRAFVDLLEKYQDESEANAALFAEAQEAVRGSPLPSSHKPGSGAAETFWA